MPRGWASLSTRDLVTPRRGHYHEGGAGSERGRGAVVEETEVEESGRRKENARQAVEPAGRWTRRKEAQGGRSEGAERTARTSVCQHASERPFERAQRTLGASSRSERQAKEAKPKVEPGCWLERRARASRQARGSYKLAGATSSREPLGQLNKQRQVDSQAKQVRRSGLRPRPPLASGGSATQVPRPPRSQRSMLSRTRGTAGGYSSRRSTRRP